VVYRGAQFECLGGAGYLITLEKENGNWTIKSENMLWIS